MTSEFWIFISCSLIEVYVKLEKELSFNYYENPYDSEGARAWENVSLRRFFIHALSDEDSVGSVLINWVELLLTLPEDLISSS